MLSVGRKISILATVATFASIAILPVPSILSISRNACAINPSPKIIETSGVSKLAKVSKFRENKNRSGRCSRSQKGRSDRKR